MMVASLQRFLRVPRLSWFLIVAYVHLFVMGEMVCHGGMGLIIVMGRMACHK